jgi:hypothetical protein
MDLNLDFLGDIDTNILGVAILCAAVFIAAMWFGPGMLGLKGYPLMTKIIASVAIIPLSYFVVNYIANK